MPEASLYLKICTVALLLFITTYIAVSPKASAKSLASALFTFSLAGYVACQISYPVAMQPVFRIILMVAVIPVAVAFYVLAEALFEERFQLTWRHLALYIFVKSVNLCLNLNIFRSAAHWERFLPQLITLALVSHALWKIFIVKRNDLVETRRKFRIRFIATTGSLILIVLAQEIVFTEHLIPAALELVTSAAILCSVWYFGIKLFHSGGDSFSTPQPGEKTDAAALSEDLKSRIALGLRQAMEQDKIYTQEKLSIAQLADTVKVQEYLLRRYINSVLGYRNFNDFINDFRIREAQRILRDKSEDRLAIIHIALNLGFGSLAPFNRAFREKTGMPPSEFRKTAS